MLKIEKVFGTQILDSRGNPTVSATVFLSDGSSGVGIAPSGASTGKYEAHEKRDGDMKMYGGKSVLQAVKNIDCQINDNLKNLSCVSLNAIDKTMIELDGTENKKNLGANAILAVSMASARALAAHYKMPLFRFIGGVSGRHLPVPMMNILNGGAHASNNIDIQEFMIMPTALSFKDGLRACTEIYHCLGGILKSKGLSTAVGDEGGFAPNLGKDEDAIETIIKAIEKSGYSTKDIKIALDVAGSEWASNGGYLMPKRQKFFTTTQMVDYWKNMTETYPIISIEDPLSEDDWDGFTLLTSQIGDKVQIVGDDLFVTNIEKLKKGIKEKSANAILIKPNQIGTITETIDTVMLAKRNSYNTIMSHRSGETEDTFIADLSVALNTMQIKTGAPCRSDRVAKYNRLIRISDTLNGK